MLPKEKINRINELAAKSKSEGLTTREQKEQEELRKEYIAAFREHFIAQLECIEIVDGDKSTFKN